MLGVRDWPIISMLKGKLRGLEVQDGGMSLCCVLRQDILLAEFLSPRVEMGTTKLEKPDRILDWHSL